MTICSHSKLLFYLLLVAVVLLISPAAGAEVVSGQSTTVTLVIDEDDVEPQNIISHVHIDASDEVKAMGYLFNLKKNISSMEISGKADTHISIILLGSLEEGKTLNITLTYVNKTDVLVTRNWQRHPFELYIEKHGKPTDFYFNLSICEKKSNVPPVDDPEDSTDPGSSGPSTPGSIPTLPDLPDVPDTPSEPETPDTPGSDEPFVPILPPADSVYNFAGFIPLLAGFLLLFLLVAFRGNLVYRILKKHAKRHGEKPDKEEKKQLKATASAIILLIRDEERYGEWRKNREMEMRLSADIISVLDEMQYPPQIPRGAAAAEILKAAKGRINRHRL